MVKDAGVPGRERLVQKLKGAKKDLCKVRRCEVGE